MNNAKYYNDNLAYDFDLFMPKPQRKEQDKVVVAHPQRKRSAKAAARVLSVRVTPVLVTVMIVASLLAGIYMRAKITELTRDNNKINAEITELESEKTRLNVALENKISYKNIEEAAQDLGMCKKDGGQIVYIRINDKNTAQNSNGVIE